MFQEVASVDPTDKVVTLTDGSNIKFDKLLLATGGDPRFFWGDAKSFTNVFLVRGADDAARIDAGLFDFFLSASNKIHITSSLFSSHRSKEGC